MNKNQLIRFFSEFWGIEDSKIKDDLILDDENLHNHSSVRFYQFIAALESNFDVRIENINNIITFWDLSKNITSIKK